MRQWIWTGRGVGFSLESDPNLNEISKYFSKPGLRIHPLMQTYKRSWNCFQKSLVGFVLPTTTQLFLPFFSYCRSFFDCARAFYFTCSSSKRVLVQRLDLLVCFCPCITRWDEMQQLHLIEIRGISRSPSTENWAKTVCTRPGTIGP